ncbi:hypothetical protein ACFQY4_26845 [Catellatospora bangladeshensis]|uniref:hypothetical protein n=1 Tax=Catellatospora bangladeshensis TaxID=310355 RepID=UPI001941DF14|nr:hypothetical protein [Catellatospora bangladeshensis]
MISKVQELVDAEDPLVRLRAVRLHVARHPAQPVTRASWRRWFSADRPGERAS